MKFIKFFKVIIEKMESLSHQLEILNLSDNFYTGQDSFNEESSLGDLKKLIDEHFHEEH